MLKIHSDERGNHFKMTDAQLKNHSRELLFLSGLLSSPNLFIKKKANSSDNDIKFPAPSIRNSQFLTQEIKQCCESSTSPHAEALADLLAKPNLLALLEVHDSIADQYFSENKNRKESYGHINSTFMPEENGYTVDTIRMVGVRKVPDEPLGLTVREDQSGYLVIARIMAGGSIDQQGLLHVGDAICEVNGKEVTNLEELHAEIANCTDSVHFKVLPALKEKVSPNQVTNLAPDAVRTLCYMRALFSYDPKLDTLLPAYEAQEPEEIGMIFEKGDILQIVDQSDPNWWQAKVVGSSSRRTGLIPSQLLEERRKAFVRQEYDFVHKIGICGTMISKRKKKLMFSSKKSIDYDKAELILYEEVARMPPFMRKTLVLIGTQGVGRRTLKNRIIGTDPTKFGTVMPHTSRKMRELEEDGKAYHFTEREAMEADIKSNKYLENGEYNGHLYGTKIESIQSVIRSGKMCVLDCSPASLKFLRNSPDFLPYVIFLAAPGIDELSKINSSTKYVSTSTRSLQFDRYSSARYSSRRARTLESLASLYEEEDFKRSIEDSSRMQRMYEKYFDCVIINNDLNDTYHLIMERIEKLVTEPQWVPVTWVY